MTTFIAARSALLCSAVACLSSNVAVGRQDEPALSRTNVATNAEAPPAIEEVLVTARKSEERLVDVPLAISVFTAEELSQAGIRSMDDVAMATPGLNFIRCTTT